jgi:hypothetical protein
MNCKNQARWTDWVSLCFMRVVGLVAIALLAPLALIYAAFDRVTQRGVLP